MKNFSSYMNKILITCEWNEKIIKKKQYCFYINIFIIDENMVVSKLGIIIGIFHSDKNQII